MIVDILITVLVVLLIGLVWVMLYDSNRFVVRKLELADKRIKKPVRAVVIADLHNKRYGKNNETLLDAVRKQQPDFILIPGDIPTAKPGEDLEPAILFLKELAGGYPIFYANGNHEHRLKLYPEKYGDMAERYGKALSDMGIEPMVNCQRVMEDCGITVYGAEIGREYYKRFRKVKMETEYLRALLGRPDPECYTVLLAHNPDFFPQYADWGADLTVAGHTHGGVARIPFLGKGVISPGLRPLPRYDGGIFRRDKATMLLSRGLGMHTIHVRLFNPGELWVVDFKP